MKTFRKQPILIGLMMGFTLSSTAVMADTAVKNHAYLGPGLGYGGMSAHAQDGQFI